MLSQISDFIDAKALLSVMFGAVLAHVLHVGKVTRAEKIREINCINAGITTAANICELAIMSKKQAFLPIFTKYEQQNHKLDHVYAAHYEQKSSFRIEAEIDLKKIQNIETPISHLRALIYEKVNATTRVISLVNFLADSLVSLNASIDYLNEQSAHLADLDKSQHNLAVEKYFGRTSSDGNTDTSYPDTLQQISLALDSTIFFSKKVCEEMEKMGTKISKTIWLNRPTVEETDFSREELKELLPEEAEFTSWQ
ncbi:hypothetical protein [Thalassospira povalilytica]|uniref:hypothetical protein n=1 Tax=Thalassospira povalilytica TaxID=732237 RepID=UPI003AA84620